MAEVECDLPKLFSHTKIIVVINKKALVVIKTRKKRNYVNFTSISVRECSVLSLATKLLRYPSPECGRIYISIL